MKFAEICYKRYSSDLVKNISSSKSEINNKEFIILKIKLDNGKVCYGEVSPLLNFSNESIDECEKLIIDLIKNNFFNDNLETIKRQLNLFDNYPSLKFGLEQLLFNIDFQNSPHNFRIKNNTINVNALIGIEDLDKTIKDISNLISNGFQTIKVKIGRDNFADDLRIIEEIKNQFNENIILRLDVNGKWNYNEAFNNLSTLSQYNIELIEQPVKDKNEMIELAKNFNNIAPDESLTNYIDGINFIETKLFNFIILKPLIRIGLYNSINLIELANKNNVKVIITSSYESLIGRTALIYLASITNHNLAHGLGTELLKLGDLEISQDIYLKPQIKIMPQIIFPDLEIDM